MFSIRQFGYPSAFSMRFSVETEIPVFSAKSSTVQRRIARQALICSEVIKNIIPVYVFMIPIVSNVEYNGLHVVFIIPCKHVSVLENGITMPIANLTRSKRIETPAPRFNVDRFANRARATDFVWQYIPTFCVYCPLTQQIYLDYDLFNIENDRGVVVLPKTHLSCFFGVEETAITETSLMLVTNNNLSRAQLFDRKRRTKSISAQSGLIHLSTSHNFFPIILKSDLKRLKDDRPFLMLRSLKTDRINKLSHFDRSQIQTTIIEKLAGSTSRWGW